MTKSKLLDLADRVEALTTADREIDAEIWESLGLVHESHCRSWCRMGGRRDLTRKMFISAWAPTYTRSLDSAMSLIGDHVWKVGDDSMGGPFGVVGDILVYAATPALALTAACLRARAQAEEAQ